MSSGFVMVTMTTMITESVLCDLLYFFLLLIYYFLADDDLKKAVHGADNDTNFDDEYRTVTFIYLFIYLFYFIYLIILPLFDFS